MTRQSWICSADGRRTAAGADAAAHQRAVTLRSDAAVQVSKTDTEAGATAREAAPTHTLGEKTRKYIDGICRFLKRWNVKEGCVPQRSGTRLRRSRQEDSGCGGAQTPTGSPACRADPTDCILLFSQTC